MLELRSPKRALERENDVKAKADAKERSDAKAEDKREKAEAEAKAAEKKPKLKYLCNKPDCHTKGHDRLSVTDHWRSAHKKEVGGFCLECGNFLGTDISGVNIYSCRTFGDD